MSEFEAICRVGRLRTFISHLDPIVKEATLMWNEDHLYTQPRDPANVAMVNNWLHASAFDSYYAEGARFGINLERFDDYLSSARDGSDAMAHLELNAATGKLDIALPSTSFTMAVIDPDSVRNGTAVEETGASEGADEILVDVGMDGAAFTHGIDVAGMVSDHIKLDADPERETPLHIGGEGDTDDAVVEYSSALHEGSEIEAPAETWYSEDYLSDLCKPIPAGAEIRLRTGDEFPMRLDYEYAEGRGEVTVMVAPRVNVR